jgi:hypothetical protein
MRKLRLLFRIAGSEKINKKMAGNDMDASQEECDCFHGALDYGLKIIGKGDISLKVKQYEVLKAIVSARKDVLCVLPTGYGNRSR